MSQRAPPEVNGFGTRTSTSPPARSSQRLDVLRVSTADGERDDRLLDRAAVIAVGPVLVHQAGIDEAIDVGLKREVDQVGRLPCLDRPRLVPGGAEGVREINPGTRIRRLEVGLENLLVGVRRRRVTDQGDRAGGRSATTRTGVGAAASVEGHADDQGHRGRDGGPRSARTGRFEVVHSYLFDGFSEQVTRRLASRFDVCRVNDSRFVELGLGRLDSSGSAQRREPGVG